MLKLSGRKGLKWRLLPVVRFAFRLVGKDWNDFYAWMLNRQERRNSIEDILRHKRDLGTTPKMVKGLYDVSVGERYVEFMKTEGLRPGHKVLDFGCGYGRMAVPLLRYLEPGNYVGVDLAAERVRQAREYIVHEGLEDTRPAFHVAAMDNDMSYLPAGAFDFLWVHSVFSHMPLDDVRACLTGLRALMKPDGVLIANYGFADKIEVKNISAFWVPEETMRETVAQCGLTYGETGDYWSKEIAPERESYERMMRLTLA